MIQTAFEMGSSRAVLFLCRKISDSFAEKATVKRDAHSVLESTDFSVRRPWLEYILQSLHVRWQNPTDMKVTTGQVTEERFCTGSGSFQERLPAAL